MHLALSNWVAVEAAGTVVELGTEVDGVRVGDRTLPTSLPLPLNAPIFSV